MIFFVLVFVDQRQLAQFYGPTRKKILPLPLEQPSSCGTDYG